MSVYDKYETVIGLEVHAQLLTNSKAYSPDSAAFGGAPNTHVTPITLGHPGTLPKYNMRALEFAIKMGIACHSDITEVNQFARKNYFYADLPKGYQISQFDTPLCKNGYIEIDTNGVKKKIRLTQIHLEEDAGKSTHDQDPYYSLIDLNRAGVPLIEIVTEPELRSSDEAYQYLTEVRKMVRYLEICDGNMEEGSMRCDANISVRLKGETKLNERVEVKNMNSIRNVKRAIEFEVKRQIDEVEAGKRIAQDTRSFDAVKGTTFTMRSKELAHDYRYFPEPDLPPLVVSQSDIDEVASKMPALPRELQNKFVNEFGLNEYDAGNLTDDKATALYFVELTGKTKNYKAAANWVMVHIRSYLNENAIELSEFKLGTDRITELIALIDAGKISNSAASQRLFPEMIKQPELSPLKLAESLNLIQQSDVGFIEEIINKVIEQNPKELEAYKSGKVQLKGFFMGQLMKESKGKADPKVAGKLLEEILNKQ